jgi:lysosomal acid lipase/cholesteryl ester hydrolase
VFYIYSWHEQGIYDLSASIDYALNETGAEKLYYAGHSMGNTAMWVLLSEKPDYNDKIELMNALAPVAYMSHMRCLIKHFAPWMGLIEVKSNFLNHLTEFPVIVKC